MTDSASGQRAKRLQRELTVFKSECNSMQPKLYTLASTTGDLSMWTVHLMPGEHSIYRSETLEVQLSFPDLYPREPLTARFLSNIYHPNVDHSGRVLGDSLRPNEWCPALTAYKIVLCLLALLDNPDLEGEIENEAAASMYLTHLGDYNELARTTLRS